MSILDKLNDAFQDGDFAKFQKVVDKIKEIDAEDEEWCQTPLVMIGSQLAFSPDKLKFAEYLLDKGAKPNQACGSMSPLGDAAHNGLIDWMKALLDRGADVNFCEPGNYPPLLRAIASDQVDALKLLVTNPNINIQAAVEAAYGESLAKFAKAKKAKQCSGLLKELKIK